MFSGAPFRFNFIMTQNQFAAILQAIQYTNNRSPPSKIGFMKFKSRFLHSMKTWLRISCLHGLTALMKACQCGSQNTPALAVCLYPGNLTHLVMNTTLHVVGKVEFYGHLSLLKEKIDLGSWISLTS